MSREIKFRGQDDNTKEWRYGNLVGDSTIIPSGQPFEVDEGFINGTLTASCVIPETVGQYTGVGNVEIYEGDIVEIENTYYDSDVIEKFWGLVFWDESELQFCVEESGRAGINVLSNPYTRDTKRKVIGNIFENPSLLNRRFCDII